MFPLFVKEIKGTEIEERAREFWNDFPPTRSICKDNPNFWFCKQPNFFIVEELYCPADNSYNQMGVCADQIREKETEGYHPAAPGCNQYITRPGHRLNCGGYHYWYEPYEGQTD